MGYRAVKMPERPRGSTAPAKKQPFLKRHHGMLAVIIVCGWFVPPLAVLIRFGVGLDFFINIILTCLGYFPGHFHNFFLQNIRNNYGKGRTPKWAIKSGLVEDDTEYVKSTRQWGHRYGERNANNAYEDEIGNPLPEHERDNAVERFVENHGIKPAQPAGGFGDHGNETARDAGLLEGLPDEDRARRKREKRNNRAEYGAGLDEEDRLEQERERSGGSNDSRRNQDSLLGDLDDPDTALYGGGGRRAPARQDSSYSDRSSTGRSGGGGLFSKKSGRAKKSERYGLAADHKDFATNTGSFGRSSNKKDSSRNVNAQTSRYSNDNYDIVENRGSSGRRNNGGDDEDFMNHQF